VVNPIMGPASNNSWRPPGKTASHLNVTDPIKVERVDGLLHIAKPGAGGNVITGMHAQGLAAWKDSKFKN